MKIKSLALENFKGIKSLTVNFDGKNTTIYGANAAGKTTVYDAYLWLLFGKDSQGAKDFSIKPIGAQKGVEVSVTGIFEINGKTVTLKKVLKENWTKPRGKLETVYTGDITACYVDEVPYKVTDYEAYIKGICDENAFKLLSNPMHFQSDKLHWKDRRKILFEVCGDVSDATVCASDPQLTELQEMMGERSIDDFRKVLMDRRKSYQNELDIIPVRIDEAAKTIVEVDVVAAEAKAADLQKQIDAANAELSKAKSGADEAEISAEISNVKVELQALESKNTQRKMNQQTAHREKQLSLLEKAEEELYQVTAELNHKQGDLRQAENELERAQREVDFWRAQYKEEAAKQWNEPTVCPTCGQGLPKDQLEASKAKFEKAHAERLATLTESGKKSAAQVEAAQKLIQELQPEVVALNARVQETKKRCQELSADNAIVLTDMDGYAEQKAEYEQQIAAMTAKLTELRNAKAGAIAEIESRLSALKAELSEQQDILARARQNDETTKRIAEYEQKQKEYVRLFEENEKALYLCELFTQRKVDMVTDAINSKFKIARFKLFEEQKNGGIAECCEVTVNNVPYSDLNSAMKINVGLDLIATFQKHYGFAPPVFVDNAETVNELYKLDSQMIKLRVSDDKTLRVVLDE